MQYIKHIWSLYIHFISVCLAKDTKMDLIDFNEVGIALQRWIQCIEMMNTKHDLFFFFFLQHIGFYVKNYSHKHVYSLNNFNIGKAIIQTYTKNCQLFLKSFLIPPTM